MEDEHTDQREQADAAATTRHQLRVVATDSCGRYRLVPEEQAAELRKLIRGLHQRGSSQVDKREDDEVPPEAA